MVQFEGRRGSKFLIYDTATQTGVVRFPSDGKGGLVTTYAASHLSSDRATATTIYKVVIVDLGNGNEVGDWEIRASDGTTVLLSGSMVGTAAGVKSKDVDFGLEGIRIDDGFGVLCSDANVLFAVMVVYDVANSSIQGVFS